MPNLRGKTWTTTTPANVGDAQYWEDHLISDTDASRIASISAADVTKLHNLNGNNMSALNALTTSDIQKARSAVQTVENKLPDSASNVNVYPNGGIQGQVLTKTGNGRADLAWQDPASSGHTIQDNGGNNMPYQGILQFKNAAVSNDSVNSKTIVDCHGEKGDDGKSAYQYAIEGGYTGSESKFTEDLGNFETYATEAENAASDAADSVQEIRDILVIPTFTVDFTTGELMYDHDLNYTFLINQTSGNLEWEVI